ncbi:MAG: RlmE family RNA methyltransferase [Candidatus Methanomethylophilaceae archaeon]|jgi:23S rRNA (uridine2552-2'-O)-methyltransferase
MTLRDRWVQERRQERYYRLAKKEGYRSRASYKLLQIDDRFNIFKEGDRVADLGAFPGGWLQVAKERVGESGKVIGLDLRSIKPLEGVETIRGDITEDATMLELLELVGEKVDVVLSDMAPNIAGHYSTDHARSVHLSMYAINVCDRILRKGGRLVMKVFMGDMFDTVRRETEERFSSVRVHTPAATRDTSSEVYVICKGFRANKKVELVEPEPESEEGEFTVKGDFI